jgi:hypothetical protein
MEGVISNVHLEGQLVTTEYEYEYSGHSKRLVLNVRFEYYYYCYYYPSLYPQKLALTSPTTAVARSVEFARGLKRRC